MNNLNVSRRTVAKGAMWSVPAVAVAASAPAMASSGQATVSNTVCNLFYGTGTANYQTHTIFFQLASDTGTIPAGTVITNQVCVDPSTDPSGGTTWNIPQATYPDNGSFTTTFTSTSGATLASGTQMTGSQCFNVVFTFTQDVTAASYGCQTGIIWNDTASVRPASTITVTTDTNVTGPSVTNGGSGAVSYKAARRYPSSVNSSGRVPNTFISKSGLITCYPSVSSSQALQSDGADDAVCYPSGTNITTTRCNWNGTTCVTNTSGLCTPPYKGGVAGQTNIPSMC